MFVINAWEYSIDTDNSIKVRGANHDKLDIDKEKVGDIYDNFPNHKNSDLEESDIDEVGDRCDNYSTVFNHIRSSG